MGPPAPPVPAPAPKAPKVKKAAKVKKVKKKLSSVANDDTESITEAIAPPKHQTIENDNSSSVDTAKMSPPLCITPDTELLVSINADFMKSAVKKSFGLVG